MHSRDIPRVTSLNGVILRELISGDQKDEMNKEKKIK